MQSNSASRTVFLNPNFKKTHINPNFLILKPSSTIHINPAFLQQLESSPVHTKNKITTTIPMSPTVKPQIATTTTTKLALDQAKIISKSRTKIVRESLNVRAPMSTKADAAAVSASTATNLPNTSLIKIGTTKLIRTSTAAPSKQFSSNRKTIFKKQNLSSAVKGKYKLDRRVVRAITNAGIKIPLKKHTFVSKYALSRVALKENLAATKVLITKRKLLRIGSSVSNCSMSSTAKKKLSARSVNKKLEMLNINGVLYNSTRSKLQKTDSTQSAKRVEVTTEKSAGKRSIYIRGDKFVLDKSGCSLTRVSKLIQDDCGAKLKRIDIGGLTYVAKSQNVFIRTDTHKARNHLSSAKYKSINLLWKKLVKSNIPCPIFRKVGKCAAFERGRCPKVHDKMHVNICPKFLKGECNNEKCLLSHEVTLSKMPTCKFFLQGCCVRDDCPYLHKKLNEKTEICSDFLKGFCHLAEKCNKRHEFACPDFESTGKCEKSKCPYCRKKDKKVQVKKKVERPQQLIKNNSVQGVTPSSPPCSEEKQDIRYFSGDAGVADVTVSSAEIENSSESNDNSSDSDDNGKDKYRMSGLLGRRPKLGELPAFIPL